jgi:D-alanyl-D-alanine carboxypeptidase (penicillin-binding protein 5/6)
MIILKNKKLRALLCFAVILVFSAVQFNYLKTYYDEILDTTGIFYENFDKELKDENERAMEDEKEYQKILSLEENPNQKETKVEEDPTPAQNYNLNLHAISALLLDASNNRVLYEENGNKEMPMASTTKIMTCIVTLENANLSDIVTVSSYAARMPDVQLGINTGEQYYLGDLLYSLMLESHNDVAVAIAEHVGGSVEGFATMMNDKARELGCENTNFVTPNGLDADGHFTTAKDLAVIASYAIKNEKFLEITNTSTHNFKEIKSGKSFRVANKNRFLYMMEGAIGVKTGFTGDAGYCFVGAIKRTDRTLISVVLGCGWPPNKSLKWSDTKKLMNYGVECYKQRQIFEDIDLDPVFVNHGQQKYEMLDMEGDLSLLMRDDEKVKIVYHVPKVLKAPIKAGSIVGNAKYYIDGIPYANIPIYTTTDVAKIDYKFCFKKILGLWSGQNE